MVNRSSDNKPTWLRHSGIGVEFAAALAGFALLGYWVDSHYGTRPWCLVIGAALGLVGGTYNLIRDSMAAFKEQNPGSNTDDPKEKQDPK